MSLCLNYAHITLEKILNLVDAILSGSAAEGMYKRRGWIPVPPGLGQYVFNLPDGVGPEKFIGIPDRQTPIEEREGASLSEDV